MEQRVSIITLGVGDLERSKSFYERLGWRRGMTKSEGIVFSRAGGIALALFPREELARDANITDGGQAFADFRWRTTRASAKRSMRSSPKPRLRGRRF
jgi:hypothetical protein